MQFLHTKAIRAIPTSREKSKTEKMNNVRSISNEHQKDSKFINRELSWIEFNKRVLQQACDPTLPLLERIKFLAITSSNLDEFMMVRVGSLKRQNDQNPHLQDPSSRNVEQQLHEVTTACKEFVDAQTHLFTSILESSLIDSGIRRLSLPEILVSIPEGVEQKLNELEAVISPQHLDESKNFPLLLGLTLHLIVRLRREANADSETENSDEQRFDFAVIPLRNLGRIISVPVETGHAYILLEDMLKSQLHRFFPGREIVECKTFRITRNADIELREDSAADLMVGMEELLESRRLSRVIRVEHDDDCSDCILNYLKENLQVNEEDLYASRGPLDLTYLFSLHALRGFDQLRDTPWLPQINPEIDPTQSMFANIAKGDLLLVHPYESFDPVVRLIEEAAADEQVLAIKQVLYRTSKKSPIIAALKRAAQNGKYVSVIVELKARFDEERNIEWAREMERSGVQVIYGIKGLKTHAKVCIIVRRETDGIMRYMHFGTGNYNEVTANLYSDISLLTCKEDLGAEATSFFNAITGGSQLKHLQLMAASPDSLRNRLLKLIEQEKSRCEQGQKGEIIAKLNALVDPEIIEALYRASQAGVNVQLNIRGICCLRPGVPGLSDNITVVSIVDRFLEHARVLYFGHGGSPEVFISSADWMPRNLDRRIELLVPINDPNCLEKITGILRCYFQDETNTWIMDENGSYLRSNRDQTGFRAQKGLFESAKQIANAAKGNHQGQFLPHFPKVSH